MGEQPIFILPQDASRRSGRDAQRMNIEAARLVAEAVRTTLGPKGMDKMLVDAAGEVTVTNDGVTILEEMALDHPCAKMIAEIAKTQEQEIGDGTTTAVVLAGQLLHNAESLLNDGIHPTVIAKGYRLAAQRAQQALETIARPIKKEDAAAITQIATTAMTGKGVEDEREHLAGLVAAAVDRLGEFTRHDVHIDTLPGGSLADSELIDGLILEKERITHAMPSAITGKLLLINTPIEIRGTEIDARISITDPDKLQQFFDVEERMLTKMVERIAGTGAKAVFCQKGIDDLAAHYLAEQGILAVRRVGKSELDRLARASGGRIITNLADITATALGEAKVEELRIGETAIIKISACAHAKTCSILLRGSTPHTLAEARRALEDALGDVAAALASGKVVPGAGAPELVMARALAEYAPQLTGREQLAVQAFASALEIIPRTLAENAGLDPIDVLATLKAAHENGETSAGVDVTTGKTMDALAQGVLEPIQIKRQALSSAVEVAVMILRIDDVIAAGKAPQAPEEPHYR